MLADENQPVATRPLPSAFIQGEAATHQMEDIARVLLGEPENAFAAEHDGRQGLEKALKPSDIERPVALEGDRGEAIAFQMMMMILVGQIIAMGRSQEQVEWRLGKAGAEDARLGLHV